MSLFGEFQVPTGAFALERTLERVPATTVEIERVVATDGVLAPYFWVATSDDDAFEAVARDDPSVTEITKLDSFDEASLYRADWTEDVEPITYAYGELGVGVLEASGTSDGWELRFHFEDRDELDALCEYCEAAGIEFSLSRLHRLHSAEPGSQYGLTEKQEEALVTAWEMGYYETPRTVTLEDVATELDISPQSLGQRLRRGHRNWIDDALVVDPPELSAD